MASALVFELSKVQATRVREAMVGHLLHVDADSARRVADGLGMDVIPAAPRLASPVRAYARSPALQIIGKMKDTLKGRCVGILVADGSDGKAVADARLASEKAGASVKIVAPKVAAPCSPMALAWSPTGNWRARRRCSLMQSCFFSVLTLQPACQRRQARLTLRATPSGT